MPTLVSEWECADFIYFCKVAAASLYLITRLIADRIIGLPLGIFCQQRRERHTDPVLRMHRQQIAENGAGELIHLDNTIPAVQHNYSFGKIVDNLEPRSRRRFKDAMAKQRIGNNEAGRYKGDHGEANR